MGWTEGIIAVSALLNVLLGIWNKVQAGKVQTLSEGLKVVEGAIADNQAVASSDAGKAITSSIKEYGEPVAALVDQARALAHQVTVDILREREDALIAQERMAREKELLDRAK